MKRERPDAAIEKQLGNPPNGFEQMDNENAANSGTVPKGSWEPYAPWKRREWFDFLSGDE